MNEASEAGILRGVSVGTIDKLFKTDYPTPKSDALAPSRGLFERANTQLVRLVCSPYERAGLAIPERGFEGSGGSEA